jgi:GNAT superfamily N-acetyltransferase
MRRSVGQGDVILRDARADELDDVAVLLSACYVEYADVFPPPIWRAYEREIRAVRSRLAVAQLVVARSGQELAGTVTFLPDAALDQHEWPPGGAAFRLLAVRPPARRFGIGRALVAECVRRARQREAAFLGLHTAHGRRMWGSSGAECVKLCVPHRGDLRAAV